MEYFQKNFLTAEGRLNRWKYFKLLLILTLIELVAVIIVSVVFSDEFGNLSSSEENLLNIIAGAALLPTYFLDVRRLHDFNQDDTLAKISAALSFYFIFFIENPENFIFMSALDRVVCIATFVLGMYILFKPGTRGENQYGADPLEG